MNEELIDWARENNLLGGLLTLKNVKNLVDEKERRIKELEAANKELAESARKALNIFAKLCD